MNIDIYFVAWYFCFVLVCFYLFYCYGDVYVQSHSPRYLKRRLVGGHFFIRLLSCCGFIIFSILLLSLCIFKLFILLCCLQLCCLQLTILKDLELDNILFMVLFKKFKGHVYKCILNCYSFHGNWNYYTLDSLQSIAFDWYKASWPNLKLKSVFLKFISDRFIKSNMPSNCKTRFEGSIMDVLWSARIPVNSTI